MTATVPPLFGPDMLADPYAMYAQLRGPVSWNEQMGLWLVTRYDDVRWALGEPRLSSTMGPPPQDSADGSSDLLADMYTFVQSSLVFTDPPDHTRLRRLVIAAFVPSVINELAGRSARSPTACSMSTLSRSTSPRTSPSRCRSPSSASCSAYRFRRLRAISSNGGVTTSCCPSGGI